MTSFKWTLMCVFCYCLVSLFFIYLHPNIFSSKVSNFTHKKVRQSYYIPGTRSVAVDDGIYENNSKQSIDLEDIFQIATNSSDSSAVTILETESQMQHVTSIDREIVSLNITQEWNISVDLKLAQIQPFIKEQRFLKIKPVDILKEKPLTFIPTLRNPCVFVKSNRSEVKLSCLPAVFLFGTEKCGTSDLYHRLILHQHVHGPEIKEPQFFNSPPIIRNITKMHHDGSIGSYNQLFARGINQIKTFCKSHISALNGIQPSMGMLKGQSQCPHVLLDATPRYFHNYIGVPTDPFNAGLSEPKVLVPHRIKHWLPHAKLILMLRNPTDRMFSAYRYFQRITNKTSTAEHFHEYVVNGTKTLNYCLTLTSLRNCLYRFHPMKTFLGLPYFQSGGYTNIGIGIYYIFLKDWLKVFDRENIFIIKYDDYRRNVTGVFHTLLNFLNIEPYDKDSRQTFQQLIDAGRIINKAKSEPRQMWPETRTILNNLYRPYNALLYDVLKSYGYFWDSGFE